MNIESRRATLCSKDQQENSKREYLTNVRIDMVVLIHCSGDGPFLTISCPHQIQLLRGYLAILVPK